MTPPELLPASLGSCAGYYAATYLGKHKLATEGTGVRVTCEPVKDPVALPSNFIAEVDAPVELTGKHLKDFARPWSTALFQHLAAPAKDHDKDCASGGSEVLTRGQPAIILPSSSFTIFAATTAVIADRSRTALNSTTSAPTIGPGSAWM